MIIHVASLNARGLFQHQDRFFKDVQVILHLHPYTPCLSILPMFHASYLILNRSPKPELSECPRLAKLEALSADVVDLKRDADALRCRAITEARMDSYRLVR